MSERTDQFCDDLKAKLVELESRINQVRTNLDRAMNEAEDTADAKREALRVKVEEHRQEAEQMRKRLEERAANFKSSIKDKIAEWKVNRKRDELEARAEDAVEYAVLAIMTAVDRIDEAELGILDAAAARRDAEAAETKAA